MKGALVYDFDDCTIYNKKVDRGEGSQGAVRFL